LCAPVETTTAFHLRTLHVDGGRDETALFDLEPALEQGRMVCNLFAEFLATQPMEFRARLPFLTKGEIELEWAAAAGGAAYAAFFQDGVARSMGVLVAGLDAQADRQMVEGLRETVLGPMLGSAAIGEERPMAVLVIMPEAPELTPTLQLLMTALASVYFRAVEGLNTALKPGTVE